MTTVSVWLLIVVATYGAGTGQVTVLERFPTVEQCEGVRKAIPADQKWTGRCIYASIVKL